jgi:glycosyltransferase involved in cell wall biosynthesis
MTTVRLAWFSPFPPVRTGIAAVSAELVATLGRRGFAIDRYPVEAAHDFPWRHRQRPYDLVVYQFGNSSHHDYEWAYALKYPGLVVLHDTHLHHARAAFLLRERRAADYRADFIRNHPGVSPDAAELGVAGFDSFLYYQWPMVRGLVESSRLVAVHGEASRCSLIESVSTPNATTPNAQSTPNAQGANSQANPQTANSQTANSQTANSQAGNPQTGNPQIANSPTANSQADLSERIVSIRLGHGRLVTPGQRDEARRRIRAKYGIADDAVVFVCAGGITPEKRIPQVLAALRATLAYAPSTRLLVAGGTAEHYDVRADIAAHELEGHVIVAGYLESDEDLTDHLAAADVSLNLRWPTAGETSGPWLRALAAGVPTVITDLVHLGDVPSLDPRTWTANIDLQGANRELRAPVCVAIDILDEDHSLRLAMRRLATDPGLRTTLGRAGQQYWQREHSLERMVEDYERAIHRAREAPEESDGVQCRHEAGEEKLEALLAPFGVRKPW